MIQFFGLLLALTPSALMLMTNPSANGRLVLVANVLCPLVGSWMLLFRMKDKLLQALASIGLGIVFFFVNVFVAVFVGCSGHTPM